MKHLHLFPNEKFTEPFIDFINERFPSNEHVFLIIGNGINASIKKRENVKKIPKSLKGVLLLIKQMHSCDKIFLHGLFFKEIVLLLALQRWLLKKTNWIIWGGDLYFFTSRYMNLKSVIIEYFRKIVIKNFNGLITHIKGDYDLALKWYGAKGKYYYSLLYPSNLFQEINLPKKDQNQRVKCIQVGNSADPTNNHFEVFNRIEKYKTQEIEVLCPLSYGDPDYREQVILEGRRIFGEKFNPITEFLPFNEYLIRLANIDIAIFNHKRQQGMGNITTLLGLGKKVYIRNDITTWDFCKSHNLKVYNFNDNLDGLLDPLSLEFQNNNIETVKKNFSAERLFEDWKRIFEDD